ncbi:MAG: hypothetical protein J7521_00665 [Caulobacter sp.]|nr:hypothetical protein [Caulobacter sp.]
MAAIAFPFHRVRAEDVMADVWQIIDDDVASDLGYYLPLWDYGTNLRLKRRIRVNLTQVAASLGLDAQQLRLRLVVTVATAGRHRWLSWSDFVDAENQDLEAEFDVDGASLSQDLTLRTELLLKAPVNAGGLLTPKREGTRLWDDSHYLRLEPEEIRFPIETASFDTQFPECRDALWKLEWSAADLSQEFVGAFRLFINSDVPDFVGKLSDGDPTTVRLLMGSVRLQITRGALDNDALDQLLITDHPTSVAAGVGAWLQLAFPGQDLASVRRAAALDPSGFEGKLMALGDPFEEDER